jgi:hypothetical protein
VLNADSLDEEMGVAVEFEDEEEEDEGGEEMDEVAEEEEGEGDEEGKEDTALNLDIRTTAVSFTHD